MVRYRFIATYSLNAIAITLSAAMQLPQPFLRCRRQVQAFHFSLYMFERRIQTIKAGTRPPSTPGQTQPHWTNILKSWTLIVWIYVSLFSKVQ